QPLRWLDALHRYGATHSGGVNFALAMLNEALEGVGDGPWDFTSLEHLGVTGEPVVAQTVHRFLRHMTRYGLRPGVLHASYGMTEVGGIARSAGIAPASATGPEAFVAVGA
ncbi:MAG: AMP-binding protein, partial [Gammaproteobacteria bacterium]|nr:AMP-binding protein [Gammaproteobacteria bacterium]